MAVSTLGARVGDIARWLDAAYALGLHLDAGAFVLSPDEARVLVPAEAPRTGVLAVEDEDELWLGLYVDPLDVDANGGVADLGALVEETSHLVCLAWHGTHALSVTRLALELQAEVDRFVLARLLGGDPFRHFSRYRWLDDCGPVDRERYRRAHCHGERYCRQVARRFPGRGDTAALLRELRGFYRAGPAAKLRAAGA